MIDRLNDEYEDKTATVAKLRSRLQRLQQSHNIPSADVDSEAGDLDHASPRTGASQHNGRDTNGAHSSRSYNGHAVNGADDVSNSLKIDLTALDSTRADDSATDAVSSAARWQHEVFVLKGQLDAERDLVESLKNELRLQEKLHVTSSAMSRRSSAAAAAGVPLQNGDAASSEDLQLREHLQELRQLRLQLEESIERNKKLQELLTTQLTDMGVDAG